MSTQEPFPTPPDHDDGATQVEPSRTSRWRDKRMLAWVIVPLLAALLVFLAVKVFAGLSDADTPTKPTVNTSATHQTDRSTTKTKPAKTKPAKAKERTDKVCVKAANLRSGPGTDHPVVGSVKRGEQVLTVPSKDKGWSRLVGTKQYISRVTLCG